jgi:hypothetical protein
MSRRFEYVFFFRAQGSLCQSSANSQTRSVPFPAMHGRNTDYEQHRIYQTSTASRPAAGSHTRL